MYIMFIIKFFMGCGICEYMRLQALMKDYFKLIFFCLLFLAISHKIVYGIK